MMSSTTQAPPMFHPKEDVLAVIDDAARADAAVEALHAAGFDDAQIHIFRGRAQIEGLARSWWKHSGVPAIIAPFLAAFLSDEYDIEKRYESEGLAGHTVLGIHTGEAAEVKRAADVLRDFAAHDLRFFGRWTITELWPSVGRHAQQEAVNLLELGRTQPPLVTFEEGSPIAAAAADGGQRSSAQTVEMEATAQALVAPGRGILAADESSGTIEKRLRSVNVDSTEDSRRAYRNLLFTAPGVETAISGVILFDETIRQAADDGTPFPELLGRRGIIPGIKVDRGTKPLAGAPDEKITEGLDGLRGRLDEYRVLGARFSKWRAVLSVGSRQPSDYAIRVNAQALARFAALSQEEGLVPIVEPEVLMDGEHTIERSFEATSRTLQEVFAELHAHGVRPEAMLLKPNMVLSGYSCPVQATHQEVASWTLRCLRRHVPSAVPGIVFLSGGQSDENATANLDALNRVGGQPWQLSFSYGRALQTAALKAWAGLSTNVPAAQRALAHRARMNGMARTGSYVAASESVPSR